MVERFFLYGINGETGRFAVTQGIKFSVDILADVTETGLPFPDPAVAWAKGAENAAVFLGLPPNRLFHTVKYPAFSSVAQEAVLPNPQNVYLPFQDPQGGSASLYCADLDGIVIEIVYKPRLSPQEIR